MKKKQKKIGDTEKHALFVILPIAILSAIYLLLRYPEPATITTINFYYASFVLIMSGVFCLIANLYWGSLLFLCGIGLMYLTQEMPILNVGINGIIFIVDFLLFSSYFITGTLKRINRILLPAIQSARDWRSAPQNAVHASQVEKASIPNKATRRRWREKAKG